MDLQGKTALVTGSSRGIGKAIALELARRGANIAVNYAGSEEKAAETVEAIETLGVQAIKIQANDADESSVKSMIKEVTKTFDSLDILVNNAGITKHNWLLRMKEEEFHQVVASNLKGPFLPTTPAARPMMEQRAGKIINVASVVGVSGNPGQANHVAAKSGLTGLTK